MKKKDKKLTDRLPFRLCRPNGERYSCAHNLVFHLPKSQILVLGCDRTSHGRRTVGYSQPAGKYTNTRDCCLLRGCWGHGWSDRCIHSMSLRVDEAGGANLGADGIKQQQIKRGRPSPVKLSAKRGLRHRQECHHASWRPRTVFGFRLSHA